MLRLLLTGGAVMMFSIGVLAAAPAQALQFWSPPVDPGRCTTGSSVEPLTFEKRITGWKRDHVASQFVEEMGVNLSRAVAQQSYDVRGFAEAFLRAIDSRAFTRLDFEGPGGPVPVYATSLVLISAAYTVDLFDQHNVWQGDERQRVIEWGDKLDRNQNEKRKYASVDSIAAIAAARMAWGAATDQEKVFKRGLKDFMKTANRLGAEALFEDSARDNNEDVSFMLVAAEAAMRSGLDVYAMSFNGVTLHDAVNAHAELSIKIGTKKLRENEGIGGRRSYLRENGYATHVAWIPIYLSRFPDGPAAVSVRRLHEAVRAVRPGPFHGTNIGGPTECLWGRIS